jgi:hypothetical protein
MAVAGGDEGRRHVIAEQRDVGGVGAGGDTERAVGAGPVERRRLAKLMSTKSILSLPVIPATVPEKLAELSSFRVPVPAKKITGCR